LGDKYPLNMIIQEELPIIKMLKVFALIIVSATLLAVFSTKSRAQEAIRNQQKDSISKTSVSVQTKPEFPGGMVEFYKFWAANFKTPSVVHEKKIYGKLYWQFVVETDGSLSEIKILKDLGYGLGDEGNRVLKISPKWIPSVLNGKPARMQMTLPMIVQ
jgi:hypothetical protein